jgi:hypothetical protein
MACAAVHDSGQTLLFGSHITLLTLGTAVHLQQPYTYPGLVSSCVFVHWSNLQADDQLQSIHLGWNFVTLSI